MDDQQKQLIAKLKDAQNVLVTVSNSPSVDQLSAAIALTLALNKLGKHATAVYSGQTPSTIEFLKPEETLESNTDSLRDFIIALDKSKADKLRYKVEDQVVRIFITPYKTSISENDLDFSQGDFNVDVVIALGVQVQQDIDDAIQAHGRILHDAVVSSIAVEGQPELGTLNVVKPDASSLSEVVASLVEQLDKDVIDGQIATALLTGIVATTDRFSNDRTSPETMNISAHLMSAGANQQLIVNELEKTEPIPEVDEENAEDAVEPGTLEIDHDLSNDGDDTPQVKVDADGMLVTEPEGMLPQVDDTQTPEGSADESDQQKAPEDQDVESAVTRERMVEPPSRDGMLTANVEEESLDAPTETLMMPSSDTPFLSHEPVVDEAQQVPAAPTESEQSAQPQPLEESTTQSATEPDFLAAPGEPPFVPPAPQLQENAVPSSDATATPSAQDVVAAATPLPPVAPELPAIDTNGKTLSDIEQAVHSPHAAANVPVQVASVDDARDAVEEAYKASTSVTPEPIAALNAQPLGPELHQQQQTYQPAPGFGTQTQTAPSPSVDGTVGETHDTPLPGQLPPVAPPASTFPGSTPQQEEDDTLPKPPPVPPPPIIPAA